MKLQKGDLIAKYEAKLICRSFLFRLLSLTAIVGLNFLLWTMHQRGSSMGWLMYHQSFSFSLVSAYLYNIVQALVLLFVSTKVFYYTNPFACSKYYSRLNRA